MGQTGISGNIKLILDVIYVRICVCNVGQRVEATNYIYSIYRYVEETKKKNEKGKKKKIRYNTHKI